MAEECSSSEADDDNGFGLEAGSYSDHSQPSQEQQGQLGEGEYAESHEQSTSTRRGKRKGAYTEEERRYRRRLANRESARRMRAKRSEAFKDLESTVGDLKDRNKQLERQNKAYAKSLQKLQAEMDNLRTQLQDKQNAAQQQSSSELQQVLSCGTAMQPHQQNVLLHGAGNAAHGLCFPGQFSFSGGLHGLPSHSHTVAAAAAAGALAEHNRQPFDNTAAGGLAILHQQQQLWQLQALQEQQSWQQLQAQQQGMGRADDPSAGAAGVKQEPAGVLQQPSAPGAAGVAADARAEKRQHLHPLQNTEQQQQQQHPANEQAVMELFAQQMQSKQQRAAGGATGLGAGLDGTHAGREYASEPLPTLRIPNQEQPDCRRAASSGLHASSVISGMLGSQAAASTGGAATHSAACASFSPAAEELLSELMVEAEELLLLDDDASALQAVEPAAAMAAASTAAAASQAVNGAAVHSSNSQQEQHRPQQLQLQVAAVKQSGFQPWSPRALRQQQQQQPLLQAASDRLAMLGQGVTAAAAEAPANLPALWHGLLQQQAALQKQQQQQQQPASAPAASNAQQTQRPTQASGPATAAGMAPSVPAKAEGEGGAEAANAAAAMLAARGRFFAAGYGNQMSFCGFEVPEVEQPAASQPAAKGPVTTTSDQLETWARRFAPSAAVAAGGATTGVLQQLGGALQLGLPDLNGGLAPALQLSPPSSGAAAAPASQLHSGTSGSSRRHGHHHSHHSHLTHPQMLSEPELAAARKLKRRFPLKRPSRLVAQQAAAVAAAAAAAGLSDMKPASTACEASCGADWPAAGTAMQVQLEQQKRRRVRKHLHAAAAAVGDDALRIISCNSRVGPAATATAALSDEAVGAVAAAEEATGQGAEHDGAAASPTSRHRASDSMLQQSSRGAWAAKQATAADEAACLQRAHSSVDQRACAFSVPCGVFVEHPGPDTSVAADGCRSYASEGADVVGPEPADGTLLDWAGCLTADMDQWDRQLLQLQHQGQQQQQQQQEEAKAVCVASVKHVQDDSASKLPAVAVTAAPADQPSLGAVQQTAADAVGSGLEARVPKLASHQGGSVRAAVVLGPAAGAAAGQLHGGTAAGLSPQLQQLQQQLQHHLQRVRSAPVQQQQHQLLQRSGSDDLDHAVPGSPVSCLDVQDCQPLQQQQRSGTHATSSGAAAAVEVSNGPAAAAVPVSTAAAGPCISNISRGSEATSPKAAPFAGLPRLAAATELQMAAAGVAPAATGAAGAGAAAGAAAVNMLQRSQHGSMLEHNGLFMAKLGAQDAQRQQLEAGPRGPAAAASAPVSCVMDVGGVDVGDLELPESPPELDALLASMLQQEQEQQLPPPPPQQRAEPVQSNAPVSGPMPPTGTPAGQLLLLQLQQRARGGTSPAGGQGHALVPGRVPGAAGQSTLRDLGSLDPVEAAMQDQLRLELTEASAGLQDLWLDPGSSGCALLPPDSISGLGLSVAISGALPSAHPGAAPGPAAAAPGSSSGVVAWGGLNPGGVGAASLALPSTVLPMTSAGAAAPDIFGLSSPPDMLPQPRNSAVMAAAAAAAGMPPWSTWHEQQQQWLDDIFSSGPTLPHEPDTS